MRKLTSYSAFSPPPMRGFVIRPFHNDEWDGDIPIFSTKRIPIVGVVVRTTTYPDDEDGGGHGEILPVILLPCYAEDEGGGLYIYESGDNDDPAFSVVWCHWPEDEDESRLPEIHAYVEEESRRGYIRRKRLKESRE